MAHNMIQNPILSSLILTAAAFSDLGASPPANTVEPGARKWGAIVDNQQISIATSRASYESGERILLDIRLRNVGATSVPTRYPEPFEYDFVVSIADTRRLQIRDRHGQPFLPESGLIPRTLYGRLKWDTLLASTGPSGELKPGQERRVEVDLGRIYDMSVHAKYMICAQRKVWKSRAVEQPSTATSNTIEITVRDVPFFRRVHIVQ